MRLIFTETSLEKDLLRLMVVRVMLVSLFLGVSAILHFTERVDIPYSRISERAHYILIAFVYFLSLFWALLLNRTTNKRKLAYLQLLFDALTVTCMVYITGGVQSIFSLLYFLVIMSAGLILGKRAGYILASLCAILYGGLGDLHYYGIISPMGYFGTPLTAYPEIMFFYRIVVHIFAFYLVAFLTGLLYQRLSSSVREFKRLQSLTNNLLQNNITGIVLADQQGEFIFTNPKAKRLLFDEPNRSDGSLVNHIKELLGRLKSSNSLSLNTWKLLELPNENGMSYHQVMLSQIALPDESNPFYAIYIQDITEMKVLEEELNKMESLAMVGGLAAKIAHEVKNPLAIINTVMEMLQEETGSTVGKRLFEIAFREIGRIQALIHDLLMLARPKRPFFKEIYIGEFLEELVNVLRPIN
ncbi:MAG: histidine kinase dimerization/phospho-acceptor domain-containing protein, partial [Desulfatiglandales bacterium]